MQKNHKFDESCDFTEEERQDIVQRTSVMNNPGVNVIIGEYECPVNPCTYVTFSPTNNGELYEDVLSRYMDMMKRGTNDNIDVYKNIYKSKGYSEDEFEKDYASNQFVTFLSGIIDEVMFDYENGDFHLNYQL